MERPDRGLRLSAIGHFSEATAASGVLPAFQGHAAKTSRQHRGPGATIGSHSRLIEERKSPFPVSGRSKCLLQNKETLKIPKTADVFGV